MFAAARTGDQVVEIVNGGRSRLTDPVAAIDVERPLPLRPIIDGCPSVLIGDLPAARVGDMVLGGAAPEVLASGSSSVLIGYLPAARLGDRSSNGGIICGGSHHVLIG
jgi:uncharacterized Zn-binding protein involved in type VI secretion